VTFLRQCNCLATSKHLSYFCHLAADSDGYGKGNVIMFLRKQQTELASLHPVEFLPAPYSISVRLVVLLPFFWIYFWLNSVRAASVQVLGYMYKIQLLLPLLSSKSAWAKHQLRMSPVGGSKSSPHVQRCKSAKSRFSADMWLRILFWKDKPQRQSLIGLPTFWHTAVVLKLRTLITQWCKNYFSASDFYEFYFALEFYW
jgi:hypothetical protein